MLQIIIHSSIETEHIALRSISSQATTEPAEQICGLDNQISDDDNHQNVDICTRDEKAIQTCNQFVEKKLVGLIDTLLVIIAMIVTT